LSELLVVIGAGRHGSEILSYLRDCGDQVELAGFIDDDCAPGPWKSTRVLGGIGALRDIKANRYITAVGSNSARRKLVKTITSINGVPFSAWTLQHPRASVGDAVVIGEGSCLAPGSIVTTNVTIGRHVILNVKASVSHDCQIGDFVNLNPGATICGDVSIEEGAYIGAGATVIDKVRIGAWTIVGAGSVVIDDLPAGVTAVGCPARIIKRHE